MSTAAMRRLPWNFIKDSMSKRYKLLIGEIMNLYQQQTAIISIFNTTISAATTARLPKLTNLTSVMLDIMKSKKPKEIKPLADEAIEEVFEFAFSTQQIDNETKVILKQLRDILQENVSILESPVNKAKPYEALNKCQEILNLAFLKAETIEDQEHKDELFVVLKEARNSFNESIVVYNSEINATSASNTFYRNLLYTGVCLNMTLITVGSSIATIGGLIPLVAISSAITAMFGARTIASAFVAWNASKEHKKQKNIALAKHPELAGKSSDDIVNGILQKGLNNLNNLRKFLEHDVAPELVASKISRPTM